jgi:hypothetical protein
MIYGTNSLHGSLCFRDVCEISFANPRGGMQELGLSGTACNPPLFQHDYEEISVRLPKLLL